MATPLTAVNNQSLKYDGKSLIDLCKEGDLDGVKYFVSNKPNIHTEFETAMKISALNGHIEIMEYLVTNGADEHACNDYIKRLRPYMNYRVWCETQRLNLNSP